MSDQYKQGFVLVSLAQIDEDLASLNCRNIPLCLCEKAQDTTQVFTFAVSYQNHRKGPVFTRLQVNMLRAAITYWLRDSPEGMVRLWVDEVYVRRVGRANTQQWTKHGLAPYAMFSTIQLNDSADALNGGWVYTEHKLSECGEGLSIMIDSSLKIEVIQDSTLRGPGRYRGPSDSLHFALSRMLVGGFLQSLSGKRFGREADFGAISWFISTGRWRCRAPELRREPRIARLIVIDDGTRPCFDLKRDCDIEFSNPWFDISWDAVTVSGDVVQLSTVIGNTWVLVTVEPRNEWHIFTMGLHAIRVRVEPGSAREKKNRFRQAQSCDGATIVEMIGLEHFIKGDLPKQSASHGEVEPPGSEEAKCLKAFIEDHSAPHQNQTEDDEQDLDEIAERMFATLIKMLACQGCIKPGCVTNVINECNRRYERVCVLLKCGYNHWCKIDDVGEAYVSTRLFGQEGNSLYLGRVSGTIDSQTKPGNSVMAPLTKKLLDSGLVGNAETSWSRLEGDVSVLAMETVPKGARSGKISRGTSKTSDNERGPGYCDKLSALALFVPTVLVETDCAGTGVDEGSLGVVGAKFYSEYSGPRYAWNRSIWANVWKVVRALRKVKEAIALDKFKVLSGPDAGDMHRPNKQSKPTYKVERTSLTLVSVLLSYAVGIVLLAVSWSKLGLEGSSLELTLAVMALNFLTFPDVVVKREYRNMSFLSYMRGRATAGELPDGYNVPVHELIELLHAYELDTIASDFKAEGTCFLGERRIRGHLTCDGMPGYMSKNVFTRAFIADTGDLCATLSDGQALALSDGGERIHSRRVPEYEPVLHINIIGKKLIGGTT